MKGKNHTEVWLMGCGSACNAHLIHPMQWRIQDFPEGGA